MIEIRSVADAASIAAAKSLVRDHFQAHSENHSAEEIEGAVAALPNPYVAPRGAFWVAWENDVAVGCVAIQEIDHDTAELKRMYVPPECRRRGIAKLLTEHAIAAAKALGYSRLRLGTLASMSAAQELYTGLGFRRIEPYRPVEFGDTWFYELTL